MRGRETAAAALEPAEVPVLVQAQEEASELVLEPAAEVLEAEPEQALEPVSAEGAVPAEAPGQVEAPEALRAQAEAEICCRLWAKREAGQRRRPDLIKWLRPHL